VASGRGIGVIINFIEHNVYIIKFHKLQHRAYCSAQTETIMFVDIALQNIASPAVLFFLMGAAASLARSDLEVPDQVARLLSLYLMMSIGYRGGIEIAHHGVSMTLLGALAAGVVLSFVTPVLAERLLRLLTRLGRVDRAAIAGHYGSISAVTFAAVTAVTVQLAMPADGFMVAVAAAMETPAILSCLLLAGRGNQRISGRTVLGEVFLNGSVVTLLGALVVGAVASPGATVPVKSFLVDLFPGFLCLFLLEMGLIAGRGIRDSWRTITPGLLVFAAAMPLLGATMASGLAIAIGLSTGNTAVFMTLGASASYIAVPAALRLALPKANLAVALTLSIGVTFPFNLLLGIPLYVAVARALN
jgi:hypothetical protein